MKMKIKSLVEKMGGVQRFTFEPLIPTSRKSMSKFLDITKEESEIIMGLQFSADKDIKDKDIYFREIYFGWIKREIDEERRKSDEENDKIKKLELKKILLKLKNISKIDEIEKLYDEFILIRRLGYV